MNADNGLQIRNAVFVAQSMAEFDGSILDMTHLELVIASKKRFLEDYQGVGPAANLSSYS